MEKKLVRTRDNRIAAGVCGGIAEYVGIDASIVRLVWIVLSLAQGIGILAYIVAVVVMPEKRKDTPNQEEYKSRFQQDMKNFEENQNGWAEPVKFDMEKSRLIFGLGIMLVGVLFLIKQFLPGFDIGMLWPLILVAIGVFVIIKGRRDTF